MVAICFILCTLRQKESIGISLQPTVTSKSLVVNYLTLFHSTLISTIIQSDYKVYIYGLLKNTVIQAHNLIPNKFHSNSTTYSHGYDLDHDITHNGFTSKITNSNILLSKNFLSIQLVCSTTLWPLLSLIGDLPSIDPSPKWLTLYFLYFFLDSIVHYLSNTPDSIPNFLAFLSFHCTHLAKPSAG